MEAFNSIGNHLVSSSNAVINATDDLSTIDPDESVLNLANGARRRRHDDDESEALDDDDLESMANLGIDGKQGVEKVEEEVELPPHACAYVPKEGPRCAVNELG